MIGGVLLLDPMLNDLLIENLAVMLDTVPIHELRILRFNLPSACIDIATILFLSVISSLGVFMSCRRIRPINIIRNKE